ncbi:MAG: M48 family metalloprotease [Pirellulaceae bacterium]|nr:M48 family metalloprotease [Pirellulaceae bacterium]
MPPVVDIPKPLPYHDAIRDLVKKIDANVWDWFGKQQHSPAAQEALKFELLKSTYRLSPQSHPTYYAAAAECAEKLGIKAPLTIYQAQADTLLNASIMLGDNEIHIVLFGDIDNTFDDAELRALFGHELGHYVLQTLDDGEHLRAWDILRATTLEERVHPAFMQSFRKLSLYTEIYCDQVALRVVDDLDAVVSTLVKLVTGIKKVVPAEFLKQAHEILSRPKSDVVSEGVTHPEAYLRAAAAQAFHKQAPKFQSTLTRWIEGPWDTANLDLLQQRDLSQATRVLIREALQHRVLQSDLMLSHARLYFEDFTREECVEIVGENLLQKLSAEKLSTEALVNYFCYVLLDFATADRDLDEVPLASVLCVAEKWKIKDALLPLVRKEMKLRKNQVELCDKTKTDILSAAK